MLSSTRPTCADDDVCEKELEDQPTEAPATVANNHSRRHVGWSLGELGHWLKTHTLQVDIDIHLCFVWSVCIAFAETT